MTRETARSVSDLMTDIGKRLNESLLLVSSSESAEPTSIPVRSSTMSNCALCGGEGGLLANLRILLPGRLERTPIYLCETCVADLYEENRAIRTHDLTNPAKANLSDWVPLEHNGLQLEWAARRSLTDRQPSISIVVRRSAGAAEYGTTYPDGTPLTDEVAREVAWLYWNQLTESDD